MGKPLSQKAWLRDYRPIWKDRHIEEAWLKEHWVYGGRIHEETSSALVAALRPASTKVTGHALYFRLFAEFANALEIAGAWGWCLRERQPDKLLLDTFLSYPPDAPRQFYLAAQRNRSGSLVRLLRLPSERKVLAALATVIPEWTDDERHISLSDCVRHSQFLARQYFGQNEIIRDTYNRAKHGATLLHDKSLSEREFWVIAPHRRLDRPNDKRRYDLAHFTVNRAMVQSSERSVLIAGALIRYLAGLARALAEADLLYSPDLTTEWAAQRLASHS